MDEFKKLIYKNLVWLFLILGLLILWFSSTYPLESYWKDVVEKIGISIFSSGVFAAVLKSIQFTGLFKEEIEKVMLSSDFIKNRSDLPDLWKNISHEVYKSKFPELSEELDDLILNTYFPTNTEYYYKNYRVTINIEELDDNNHIKFIQLSKFEIILPDKIKKKINFSQTLVIDKVEGQKFENERLYCKCNQIEVSPQKKEVESENEITYDYSVELEISDSNNHFETKDRREYSIEDDNVKLFRVGRITKEMDVSVRYPENMEVTFFNIGLVNKFEENHVEHNRVISRIHRKGIILPFQGFGLSFRRKIN